MTLEAESKTIQSTGLAKSQAQAKAESAEIKSIQIFMTNTNFIRQD